MTIRQTDNWTDEQQGRVNGGTAALARGNPIEEGDEAPFIAHGVALAADSITKGTSGIKTYWPSEVVESAVEMLKGAHLIANHPDNPGIEDIAGEVTDAAFIEGVGLAWEGEIDDAEVAEKVQHGRVDASPYMYRNLTDEKDADHDARVATEIVGIRDLGIVREGAGEGVAVEPGQHAALGTEALSEIFDGTNVNDDGNSGKGTNKPPENQQDSNGMSNDSNEVEALRDQLAEAEDQIETLKDENRDMRAIFGEALAEDSPFTAETIAERFSYEEMAETYDGDMAEALAPAPKTGGDEGGKGEAPSGTDGEGVEALSVKEKQELDRLVRQKDIYQGRPGMSDTVEELDSKIEDMRGEN